MESRIDIERLEGFDAIVNLSGARFDGSFHRNELMVLY